MKFAVRQYKNEGRQKGYTHPKRQLSALGMWESLRFCHETLLWPVHASPLKDFILKLEPHDDAIKRWRHREMTGSQGLSSRKREALFKRTGRAFFLPPCQVQQEGITFKAESKFSQTPNLLEHWSWISESFQQEQYVFIEHKLTSVRYFAVVILNESSFVDCPQIVTKYSLAFS